MVKRAWKAALPVVFLVGICAQAPLQGQAISNAPSLPRAELSLAGNWLPMYHEDWPERGDGPELADYLGLPITDGARRVGLSWDSSRMSVEEHQCQVHVSPYIYRGPTQLHFWEERDPETQRILAVKNYISNYQQTRTIWMDGRPHPSEFAPHTWMGFSTGEWQGNVLKVYTTHIKQGFLRRNGLPESDQATLTEHFIRYGDNLLTHVSIVTDPVYLAEPLIRSQDFRLAAFTPISWTWPCQPVREIRDLPKNRTPHYLPDANPFAAEFATEHAIPIEAVRGGPETMYPEYQLDLRELTVPSER